MKTCKGFFSFSASSVPFNIPSNELSVSFHFYVAHRSSLHLFSKLVSSVTGAKMFSRTETVPASPGETEENMDRENNLGSELSGACLVGKSL